MQAPTASQVAYQLHSYVGYMMVPNVTLSLIDNVFSLLSLLFPLLSVRGSMNLLCWVGIEQAGV